MRPEGLVAKGFRWVSHPFWVDTDAATASLPTQNRHRTDQLVRVAVRMDRLHGDIFREDYGPALSIGLDNICEVSDQVLAKLQLVAVKSFEFIALRESRNAEESMPA